jgi:tetratricopeptide (TPR) repeat protein
MRFCAKAAVAILAMILGGAAAGMAQDAGAMSEADLNKEAATADSMYKSQNMVGALPLYEDLHKRQPESNAWRERLAMCLVAAPGSDAERTAAQQRAHQLLLDAKAAGDNSNLLQVMLEKMEAPVGTPPPGPPSPGTEAFQRAEKLFATGDLAGAIQQYEAAFAADPKMYEAPLFAGDSEFKRGNFAAANQWYAKAVAIDPDRETAYRYWGDCLMKQGDTTQAEGKFIDAIIAQPYQRTPRVGLKQWADSTGALLAPPPIKLPARPTVDAKGNVSITIDPSIKDTSVVSASMMYSMNSATWHSKKFKETYPAEAQYRHSLAEEVDGIRGALTVLSEQKITPEKMDPTWRTLSAIDKDGMLECWILLDAPDQGIAQDYLAYRAKHRDLLHAYIAKYDVHPK